jgi:hypothetical protein
LWPRWCLLPSAVWSDGLPRTSKTQNGWQAGSLLYLAAVKLIVFSIGH